MLLSSSLLKATAASLATLRAEQARAPQKTANQLLGYCERIPQQLAFVKDTSRFKAACCSRRSGKTVAAAVILLYYAHAYPDTVNLYLTLSRVSGKRIVWRTLIKLNREFNLGANINRTDLSLEFPNGSVIYVNGAKDETETEKLRGYTRVNLAVIDEAQSFKQYIQDLVDDVIMPALMDTKGTLCLIGTPGKIRDGYFYESLQCAAPVMRELLNVAPIDLGGVDEDDDDAKGPQEWSVHHWTIRDNPFIPDVDDELAKLRRRKHWAVENPTYQREYLGRWVTEHSQLVYKYDQERNGYMVMPDVSGLEWRCLLVVDQGYHDADAIGRLWFREKRPGVWLQELWHERKQTAGQLAAKGMEFWEQEKGRTWRFLWDEGGGGKKVAEDVRRQGIPVEAVEKGPGSVIAAIELTNDALVSGALKIPARGHAAGDAGKVTWDPKARGVKLSERYHTDMWDVVKYGIRALNGIVAFDKEAIIEAPPTDIDVAAAERRARIQERIKRNSADAKPGIKRLLR